MVTDDLDGVLVGTNSAVVSALSVGLIVPVVIGDQIPESKPVVAADIMHIAVSARDLQEFIHEFAKHVVIALAEAAKKV